MFDSIEPQFPRRTIGLILLLSVVLIAARTLDLWSDPHGDFAAGAYLHIGLGIGVLMVCAAKLRELPPRNFETDEITDLKLGSKGY